MSSLVLAIVVLKIYLTKWTFHRYHMSYDYCLLILAAFYSNWLIVRLQPNLIFRGVWIWHFHEKGWLVTQEEYSSTYQMQSQCIIKQGMSLCFSSLVLAIVVLEIYLTKWSLHILECELFSYKDIHIFFYQCNVFDQKSLFQNHDVLIGQNLNHIYCCHCLLKTQPFMQQICLWAKYDMCWCFE